MRQSVFLQLILILILMTEDKKIIDIWSGEFNYFTESTFDLSSCVSTRSCADELLFTVLDTVSRLDEPLEEIKLDAFITMSFFTDQRNVVFYNRIYQDATMKNRIEGWWQALKNVINRLDSRSGLDSELKKQCLLLFRKV